MKKAAIALIVIAILVIVGTELFLSSQEPPAPPPERDDTTLRQTTGGEVVGFIDRHGARAWLGVPFAVPPVGVNRWRAPAAPERSSEVFEALAAGTMCPQFGSLLSGNDESGQDAGDVGVVGDEDCLYLNVWSPPNARNRPVMFWIHGGGNTIGHGGSYNGATLASTRDVVVITINYRLGVFGWFNHPALAVGDPLHDSGNFGTLDIVRALEWVRDNAREFGGDPDNVTVFGESAGAFDTLAMMASPLAEGLFHRAIVQSGGFRPTPESAGQNYADEGGHANSSREIVIGLLVNDGTVSDRNAARSYQDDMSKATLRQYLYSKTPQELFALFDGGGFGMINLPDNFGDGYVLPDMTTQEIFSNTDNYNPVPVILGTNRDESALFMVRDPRYVNTYLGVFSRLKDPDTYTRIVRYSSLAWKVRGVDEIADWMVASGHPDVFAYRFEWDEEPSLLGYDLSVALGAAHGLEIAFAFGDFTGGLGLDYIYPNDEAQHALSQSMTSYWSEFAYTGDPGQGRNGQEPHWRRWGTNGEYSLILDSPKDQGIHMMKERVTWQSLKQQLADDTNFPDNEDRCNLYVRNFHGTPLWSDAQYSNLDCTTDPSTVSRF